MRCLDAKDETGAGSGLTIRDEAFYIDTNSGGCACSAGSCSEQDGVGASYASYSITFTDPNAPVVISRNTGTNNDVNAYTCTPDASEEFPGGAYYSFSNGDTVWTSSVWPASEDGCGNPLRDLSNAFVSLLQFP